MKKRNRGVNHTPIDAHADAKACMDPLRPPRGWWKIGRLVVYNRKGNQLCGVAWRGVHVRAWEGRFTECSAARTNYHRQRCEEWQEKE